MNALSGRTPMQIDAELSILEALMPSCRAYLEVGARNGDTFYHLTRLMPAGSLAVAIDLPGVIYGEAGSDECLLAAAATLRPRYHTEVLLVDSRFQTTADRARALAPDGYDLIFIDGDHRYESVVKDWSLYSPLGRTVALHDIANPRFGVMRLWNEIKAEHPRWRESIAPRSHVGIGLVMLP